MGWDQISIPAVFDYLIATGHIRGDDRQSRQSRLKQDTRNSFPILRWKGEQIGHAKEGGNVLSWTQGDDMRGIPIDVRFGDGKRTLGFPWADQHKTRIGPLGEDAGDSLKQCRYAFLTSEPADKNYNFSGLEPKLFAQFLWQRCEMGCGSECINIDSRTADHSSATASDQSVALKESVIVPILEYCRSRPE